MRRAVLFIALLLLIGASFTPTSAARPSTQRADGLDTPLTALNACGPGDGSELHFTIAATGDTFPHENIQQVAEANGYDYLFDYVRPYLQAADLGYTNFDGAMLASSPRSGYPNFNFNPALAPALKNAGIDVVSTANNHILDRGPEGLDATMQVLDQTSIAYHGTVPSTFGEQARPPFLTIPLSRDGITVTLGFISATWGTNGIPDPYNQVNLLYQSNAYGEQGGVRQSILDAIAQAAAATDIVLVAAHWGFEYEFYPHSSQIEAAQAMAAAGADIILGAQPHTLQPVDVLDNGGRKTLVAYSLANFIASQGAFQATAFSATAVILYVGIARSADGSVRVTGFRYLPTLHIDNDTRPAPIVAQTPDAVIDHVRTILRDPSGVQQLPAAPPSGRIEVCPTLQFPEVPENGVPGDFAQHYRTLGGLSARPPSDALRVLGYPIAPVTRELAGDCQTELSVLLTERQRLEWHAAEAWPYRIQGSQLGVAVFEQKYGPGQMDRRNSLDGDAFADPRFQRFYEAMGGLGVFGYPISRMLIETDAADVQRQVQYFERARFELDEAAAEGEQVKLGLLGREYDGIAAQCGLFSQTTASVNTNNSSVPALNSGFALQGDGAGFNWTPWLLIMGIAVLVLGGLAYLAYRREQARREFYRQRTYQRRASLRRNTMQSKQPVVAEAAPFPQQSPLDDDLLSDLLQMDEYNRPERE
jgi:hypothetical protein